MGSGCRLNFDSLTRKVAISRFRGSKVDSRMDDRLEQYSGMDESKDKVRDCRDDTDRVSTDGIEKRYKDFVKLRRHFFRKQSKNVNLL